MNILKLVVCYTAFLFIFSSCSNKAIENKFTTISDLILADSTQGVFAEFDQESEVYFEKLIQAASENDLVEATALGYENEILISTLKLYDMMAGTREDATGQSGGVFASKAMLKFILNFGGVGIFRSSPEQPIRFREVTSSNEYVAEVLVGVPTGEGAIMGTTYIFHNENDEWKLNFPSTMGLIEKIYAQGQKRSGLDEYEYAKYLNQRTDEGMEFRYRKY